MSKLSDFYKLKPKFGAYANEEQKRKMDEMEKSLIKEEILPQVKDAVTPALKDVESPITLVINYVPGKDVQVSLADDTAEAETPKYQPRMVFTHELNWSEFLYGMTIDTMFHESVFKAIGKTLPRGKSVPIKVILDGMEYDCRFENADRKKIKGNTIRLMYKGKENNPGLHLQAIFPEAYQYLVDKKREFGTRKQFPLPDDMKVTLTVSTTPSPQKYTMEYKKDKE